MNINEAIKYSNIIFDYAYLKVFVEDVSIFEPVFNLRKIETDSDGDMISVHDIEKRNIYKMPSFIEEIQKSSDNTFDNCLHIMVLDGYDIEELYNWINYYNQTYKQNK